MTAPNSPSTSKWRNPAGQPWWSMIQRCTNPRYSNWQRYGGAGIAVHPTWMGDGGFERFLEHIGERPSMGHTIDRIDGARGYVPGNVRWATISEQSRNRRNNVMLEFNGERLCARDWAERLEISQQSLSKRLLRWPLAEALSRRRKNHPPTRQFAGRQSLKETTG